jgi:hypothetical protein
VFEFPLWVVRLVRVCWSGSYIVVCGMKLWLANSIEEPVSAEERVHVLDCHTLGLCSSISGQKEI